MFVIKQPQDVLLAVDVLNALSSKTRTVNSIATEIGKSYDSIQKVVNKLRRGGIIRVVRGPGGGISINPPTAGPWTLGDIYRVLGRIEETEIEPPTPGDLTSAILLQVISQTPAILRPAEPEPNFEPTVPSEDLKEKDAELG